MRERTPRGSLIVQWMICLSPIVITLIGIYVFPGPQLHPAEHRAPAAQHISASTPADR